MSRRRVRAALPTTAALQAEPLFSEGICSLAVTRLTEPARLVPSGVAGQALWGLTASLATGDELIRVDGIEVPGNGAFILKPHMEFVPGKPKRLMFKRTDGSAYEATLTKAPQ